MFSVKSCGAILPYYHPHRGSVTIEQCINYNGSNNVAMPRYTYMITHTPGLKHMSNGNNPKKFKLCNKENVS